jgi:hypothetical protein
LPVSGFLENEVVLSFFMVRSKRRNRKDSRGVAHFRNMGHIKFRPIFSLKYVLKIFIIISFFHSFPGSLHNNRQNKNQIRGSIKNCRVEIGHFQYYTVARPSVLSLPPCTTLTHAPPNAARVEFQHMLEQKNNNKAIRPLSPSTGHDGCTARGVSTGPLLSKTTTTLGNGEYE